MVSRIVRFLRKQRPRASPAWLAKLPIFAEYLEKWLFQHSTSFDQYRNKKTIGKRMSTMVVAIKDKIERNRQSKPDKINNFEVPVPAPSSRPQTPAVVRDVVEDDFLAKGLMELSAGAEDEPPEHHHPSTSFMGDQPEDPGSPVEEEVAPDDERLKEEERKAEEKKKKKEEDLQRKKQQDEEKKQKEAKVQAADLDRRASAAKRANDPAEAEALYREALKIRLNELGERHLDVATTWNKLGCLYKRSQRYDDALPCFETTLKIRGEALGPNHKQLAATLSNIAAIKYVQGNHNDAELLYNRALFIRESTPGTNTMDVAASLNNVAAVLVASRITQKDDDLNRAASLYTKALNIYDQSDMAQDDPTVARVCENLGLLLTKLNRHDEAKPILQRARNTTTTTEGASPWLQADDDDDETLVPAGGAPPLSPPKLPPQTTSSPPPDSQHSPTPPDKARPATSTKGQAPKPNRNIRDAGASPRDNSPRITSARR